MSSFLRFRSGTQPYQLIVLFSSLLSACGISKSSYDIKEVNIDRKGEGSPTVRKYGVPISGKVEDPTNEMGGTVYRVEEGRVKWARSGTPIDPIRFEKKWKGDSLVHTIAWPEKEKVLHRRVRRNGSWVNDKNAAFPETEGSEREDRPVIMYGDIVNRKNGADMEGVYVIIRDRADHFGVRNTGSGNEYELRMEYEKLYRVSFWKPETPVKTILIDTRNVPSEEKEIGGFEMQVGISLSPDAHRELRAFLKDTAVGKASFNKGRGTIDFNNKHTMTMRLKMKRLEVKGERLREKKE